MCETPKSPPGDYKVLNELASKRDHSGSRVKHLNPRQGITSLPLGVQNHPEARCCVKHLNPRQGITTSFWARTAAGPTPAVSRVKHLNPRQGITTNHTEHAAEADGIECETPKSPPGDYNPKRRRVRITVADRLWCETPKSPPGDYNRTLNPCPAARCICVKHLNPRQGITTRSHCLRPNLDTLSV